MRRFVLALTLALPACCGDYGPLSFGALAIEEGGGGAGGAGGEGGASTSASTTTTTISTSETVTASTTTSASTTTTTCEPAADPCAGAACGEAGDGCGGAVVCGTCPGDWQSCSAGACACAIADDYPGQAAAVVTCNGVGAGLWPYYCGAPGTEAPEGCVSSGAVNPEVGTVVWCCPAEGTGAPGGD